jgi:hypothetical protein
MSDGEVTILVGGEKFVATPPEPFIFGRADDGPIVGLDPDDMGISAEAGSVEFEFNVWWVINRSRKRPLLVENNAGAPTARLDAGERNALTRAESIVLVPGAVSTHRLDIQLSPEAVGSLRVETAQGGGTIIVGDVPLSEKDRDVLTALCCGYLRPFPRHDPRTLTYQQVAELLGAEWTPTTVRKQVERIKKRMRDSKLYFEGLRANDEMAEHLIANGILGRDDLSRLERNT